MPPTLQDTAYRAVYALWERRAFTQHHLAKLTRRPQSVINRIIHGKQPVTLDIIEAVSELSQTSPAEMFARPDEQVRVLRPDEAEMLSYFRTWPTSTRDAFLIFARFFAQEPPLEQEIRQSVEYLRAMPRNERMRAHAYLMLLNEGGLSPDLQVALGLPARDEGLRPPKKTRGATTT